MTVDQARRRRFLARWHRRLALVVFAWLGVLAISGVAINHAHDWGLDQAALPAILQHRLYDIDPGNADYCTVAADFATACQSLFAHLEWEGGSALLDEHNLYVLDAGGRLLEKLPVAQLGLERLDGGYVENGQIYLRDSTTMLVTDSEFLEFAPVAPEQAGLLAGRGWKNRQEMESISWERLLLDLHAARFLGPLARVFNDVAAAVILLLVVSGFWLYFVRRKYNGNNGRGGSARGS